MGLAITNNNPGNLRDPATGSFRQFSSPQEGYAALLNDLQAKQTGTTSTGLGPSSTLIDFASKYAPASDKNNVGQYAANLANQIGVPPNAQLKDLDLGKWASAVAHNEDANSLFGATQEKPVQYQTKPALLPNATVDTSEENQPQNLGDKLKNRLLEGSQALTNTANQKINPISGALQTAGAAGGAVGDVVNSALELVPGFKGLEGLIGKGTESLLNTGAGKAAVGQYQQFAQQHPELAADIGAVGNIATAIPVLRGAGIVKDIVGTGIKSALHGGTDAVLETIAPKLTAKETAQAVASRGTTKSGLLREVKVATNPADQIVADAIKQNVPDFNPAKGLAHNIDVTQKAVTQLSDQLKNEVSQVAKGRIYSYKELTSYLKSIPRPISLVGENATQYSRLLNAAMQIAKKDGGNVESLLGVRKQFDDLVSRTYPNLYSSDTITPLRLGIKNIRNGLTAFTAKNLPEGFGLQEKLLTQHNLLTAIENMSGKIASGADKEIGSTVTSRLAKKHPLVTGVGKGLLKGALLGTGIKGAEDLIP